MLHTTDAIVLAFQPHSDKAHTLHAYTRAGGRVNYMVYGIGRKNTTGKYTPLSLVQLTADDRSIRTVNLNYTPSIRTANLYYTPSTITTDPYKRTIALFISEVLFHVLRHPMPDEPMFDFIESSIRTLDELSTIDNPSEVSNFHLQFLIDFAAKLGFAMENPPLPPLTRSSRQQQLQHLCAYFAEHVDTWQNPRSLEVLMEVYD